jgi:xylulokinase
MILSIDCGSTNHKVGLFDETLERRAVCSTPVAYSVRDGKHAEIDAERLWQDTISLIAQACSLAGVATEDVNTIALASQAQTFTIVDSVGQPIMPFISWADKRAVRESAELERALGKEFHFRSSFPAPVPQLQLAKLAWIRRNHPERLVLGNKIASLPSFLALRLAGLHVTDANLAAMSGLYSCVEKEWWAAALQACGVRDDQMGELVPVGHAVDARCGSPRLKFASPFRIVFAGNDQTAGAYANASRAGGLVVTLGTALVAYRYAGESPGPFHPTSCWGPYPGGGFYELATFDEGCSALDWAVEQVMPGAEREFIELAQCGPPGASFFYPQQMHTDSAWLGEARLVSRARAVLEGICFRTRQLLEVGLKADLDSLPLTVIGGGSQSDGWLQILANVLNCPLRRGSGDNLLGAAMMARPALRPPCLDTGPLMEPTASTARSYDSIYRLWLANMPQHQTREHG